MSDEHSGELLARWRTGEEQAASEIFRRYTSRLIALARSRLAAKLSQRIDPEDVVQSAYRSFFAGARDGQFELQRGGDLWRLLATITLHKLHHEVTRNTRARRAVQRERGLEDDAKGWTMHPQLLAKGPSPLEAVALTEELEQVMRRLTAPHRRMLELRLQGCTIDEIAEKTRAGERTVRRVLNRIKQELEEQPLPPQDPS